MTKCPQLAVCACNLHSYRLHLPRSMCDRVGFGVGDAVVSIFLDGSLSSLHVSNGYHGLLIFIGRSVSTRRLCEFGFGH